MSEPNELSVASGVVCPRCGGTKWKVGETRPAPGRLLRFRVCKGCNKRVRTREVIEADLGDAPAANTFTAAAS